MQWESAFSYVGVATRSSQMTKQVVEASSVNSFKNRLDKHWSDMGV